MFERTDSWSDAEAVAVSCLAAGVERADPVRATRDALSVSGSELVLDGERIDLAGFDRVVVVGGGKGSDRVASAVVDALDGRVDGGEDVVDGGVDDGVIVVDERSTDADDAAGEPIDTGPVEVRVGDHPIPSERGVESAVAARDVVADADASTLVLAVVTGGASALLPAPVDDVRLSALRDVTRDLLEAGAGIDEVNAVRKHVSALKGGRLAALAAPARVATIAVSDVVGDDPAVIGSGPTVPDESTYADALDGLSRYDIDAPAVRAHLERGARGDVPETPGPDDDVFDRTSYHVVASARTAVAGAVDAARDHGFEPCVLSTTVTGEARDAGRNHATVGRSVAGTGEPVAPPAVLVSAGETTVTVRGAGTGGPNQEFVLGGALEFADGFEDDCDGCDGGDHDGGDDGDDAVDADHGVDVDGAIAAVDTDGRDGSTDAAGAVLAADALAGGDDDTVDAAREALAANDAYGFLVDRDALLFSGATGTNVNDLHVLVVDDVTDP